MPSLDGGHYFLTALAPVLADPCTRTDGSITSPTASLREALATLPTAGQSEASINSGRRSPFSRCHRTHFARLVVIDQPAFNGRNPGNSLVEAIRKTDLLAHQPVDTLTRAWLLLAIDFDPADAPDGGLHDYLVGLWNVMSDELRDIYRHCYRFKDEVKDGDGFARYIQCCQVETTMPFNDYWITPLKLPTLPLIGMAVAAALFIAAATWLACRIAGFWGLISLPVSIGIAAWCAYHFAMSRGLRPFPAAPGSD